MNRHLLHAFAIFVGIESLMQIFGVHLRPTTILLQIALVLCVGFLGIFNRQEDDAE